MFEVRISLRPAQYTELNKWKCTINGEERIVSSQIVVFHVLALDDIPGCVNQDELQSINIHKEY
jgi:hypothetical protein